MFTLKDSFQEVTTLHASNECESKRLVEVPENFFVRRIAGNQRKILKCYVYDIAEIVDRCSSSEKPEILYTVLVPATRAPFTRRKEAKSIESDLRTRGAKSVSLSPSSPNAVALYLRCCLPTKRNGFERPTPRNGS